MRRKHPESPGICKAQDYLLEELYFLASPKDAHTTLLAEKFGTSIKLAASWLQTVSRGQRDCSVKGTRLATGKQNSRTLVLPKGFTIGSLNLHKAPDPEASPIPRSTRTSVCQKLCSLHILNGRGWALLLEGLLG